MAGPVEVFVDASGLLDDVKEYQKQVPFAIATGINNLMMIGQKREREVIRAGFTLRRPEFIDRSIKITQFAKKTTLIGEIAVDPAHNQLAKFEDGGEKRPHGAMLAVPIEVRRNKSDIIVASMRVRALGLRAYATARGTRLRGRYRTFTVKSPGGGAILQRVGRKPKGDTLAEEIEAGSVRVLYAFKRTVPLPPDLHFVATMVRTGNDEWEAAVDAAWAKAIATAR